MSKLVKIASWQGRSRGSVVFVHGLGGHVYNTWRRGADDTFWPVWLAQDVEGLAVYSLYYEAPLSNWLGTSMPLQDRAVNIFEVLLTEPGLRTGPIVFVCHSLGGLIVKKVLLNLQQQATRRPEANDFLERVTKIVFAATPHTGSAQSTWLDRLRFLAWPSSTARILVANDPSLRDINVAYRGLADDRRNVLHHQIFYETRDTPVGAIVNEASADPGLAGDPPVPIDADHIRIVKPPDRNSLLYARVRQFVALGPAVADGGQLELLVLPTIASDQSLNIGPKLIRIAALCLAALIAFKGVQALIAPPVDIGRIQGLLVDQLAEKDRQMAGMLVVMNNLRTTPAPPGADQELKKAVLAIDEGAKVDSRYAQALDLLKAGKPSEAEPLLKAVAEDKVKSADRENKDAAAAYRNLASIAAVSEPGRAREYYAKAAQLDPDNVEGVFWNGWYQSESGKLDVAQEAYDRVVKTAGVSDSQWLFLAQIGLGEILKRRGNLSGALNVYGDSLIFAEKLAKSDPNNADWQSSLSVSLNQIGEIKYAQGDLSAALKNYRDGHDIADKLARYNPGNADWQRDLSVSFNRIGDIQKAQGDLPGALKSYRDGLDIAGKLAKSDPGNADWQRDLSVSFSKIGDIQKAQGDPSGALKSHRDGLAIRDKLAKSDPGNAGWQRDLTISSNKVGDMQMAQGDMSGALKSYRNSLDIAEKLAKSDPGNADWQRDLSVFFERMGDVQMARGDVSGALKSFRDSFDIAEKLAKSDPGNADWQHDLALSFDLIGDVQLAQRDLSGALKSYNNGLVIRDKLAQLASGNADWQRDLSVSFERIGDIHKARGDLSAALMSYGDALAIRDKLAQLDSGNADWQRDQAISFDEIGDVQLAQDDLSGALKSYSYALTIRAKLAKLDSGNADRQRDLSGSFERTGDVKKVQGDLPGALKSYSDALTIRAKFAKLDSGNADWQRDLAVAFERIGDVKKAQGDLSAALKSYRDGLAIRDKLAKSDPGNAGWQRDRAVLFAKLPMSLRKLNH